MKEYVAFLDSILDAKVEISNEAMDVCKKLEFDICQEIKAILYPDEDVKLVLEGNICYIYRKTIAIAIKD